VARDPVRRAAIVPCTPTGNDDSACFHRFVESFMTRAWRRPVAAEDVDPYMGLMQYATERNPYLTNDFYTAVELALSAIFQDPEFLYRIEAGTALTAHELATRLSYLILGTTPDAQLVADAEAGLLATSESRRSIAERLFAEPAAKRQMQRFHAQWLGYRGIPHSAELVAAFSRETSALLDRIIFDDPSRYLDVFSSDETYVDDFLADHYGLPAPAGGQGWVSYAGTERAGILSHGSVAAAFSKFSDTSPTQRGIFVRTRLMCQTIPAPPATVDVDAEPVGTDSPCKYDRYAAHRTTASCAACHDNMDPIGFGLENLDIAGRWREHDDGLPECSISGNGRLPEYGSFNGPRELAETLSGSGVLESCMVEHMYRFALGRQLEPKEIGAREVLTDTLRSHDGRLLDMLLDYIASDVFAQRKEPGT
jgi:hypothetical protein